MKIKHSVILFALSVALCGCAKEPRPSLYTPSYDAQATMQAVQVQLAESAKSVSHSLLNLAEIEKATHVPRKLPQPINAGTTGMSELASVDWTGPIEQLVRRIAAASRYQVKVLGREPAIPVIVQISEKNKPLADILRNAHFQAAKQADIVVYPQRRQIELRYLAE